MAIADNFTVATGPRTRVRPFSRSDVDAWQAWPDYVEQLLVGTSPRRMSPDQRSRWFDDIVQRQLISGYIEGFLQREHSGPEHLEELIATLKKYSGGEETNLQVLRVRPGRENSWQRRVRIHSISLPT